MVIVLQIVNKSLIYNYNFRFAIVTELKINMTTYNKLKIAILAIFASQNIYALNVDPAIIQSSAGELLYAELNFRQSDINTPLEVSLAKPEDLMSIGATHQPPGHLNFFTRRNPNGSGVITITSSRPIIDSEINIIVKIKEGSTTRLQQIKKPLARNNTSTSSRTTSKENSLTPIMVVNEKDIALNLPTSSTYAPQITTPSTTKFEPLKVTSTATQAPTLTTPAPVVFQSTPSTNTQEILTKSAQSEETIEKITPSEPVKAQNTAPKSVSAQNIQIAPPIPQSNVSADPLVKKFANAEREKKALKTENKPEPKKVEPATLPNSNDKHIVQSNESLWAIASRVASEQNRSVNSVMQQIKANNEHAFIQGDTNRLKRGVTLNLQETSTDDNARKVAKNKATYPKTKQSGTAKYRLSQAEMSLVAESEDNSAHGSASKNAKSNVTSPELSSKVMTSREKTVKLQRNVTQLEIALNQKDHRIQLLNARLAQLQQQLKNQQDAKKSHN